MKMIYLQILKLISLFCLILMIGCTNTLTNNVEKHTNLNVDSVLIAKKFNEYYIDSDIQLGWRWVDGDFNNGIKYCWKDTFDDFLILDLNYTSFQMGGSSPLLYIKYLPLDDTCVYLIHSRNFYSLSPSEQQEQLSIIISDLAKCTNTNFDKLKNIAERLVYITQIERNYTLLEMTRDVLFFDYFLNCRNIVQINDTNDLDTLLQKLSSEERFLPITPIMEDVRLGKQGSDKLTSEYASYSEYLQVFRQRFKRESDQDMKKPLIQFRKSIKTDVLKERHKILSSLVNDSVSYVYTYPDLHVYRIDVLSKNSKIQVRCRPLQTYYRDFFSW